MTYTYTQTTDKNGKARFYRVDENGKRKVISRTEYEANTSEQISIEVVAQTAEEHQSADSAVAVADLDALLGLLNADLLGVLAAQTGDDGLHGLQRGINETVDGHVDGVQPVALTQLGNHSFPVFVNGVWVDAACASQKAAEAVLKQFLEKAKTA